MPLITTQKFQALQSKPDTYAGALTSSLERARTTESTLHVVGEYFGLFTDAEIIEHWKPQTFTKHIHFAMDQVPAMAEPEVREHGYKTLASALIYPDLFQHLGKKTVIATLDRLLAKGMKDPDEDVRAYVLEQTINAHTHPQMISKPDDKYPLSDQLVQIMDVIDKDESPFVRLMAYTHFASHLSDPKIHGKVEDTALDKILGRLQDTLSKEATDTPVDAPLYHNFEKSYSALLYQPQIMLSLLRAGTASFSYNNQPVPVDTILSDVRDNLEAHKPVIANQKPGVFTAA